MSNLQAAVTFNGNRALFSEPSNKSLFLLSPCSCGSRGGVGLGQHQRKREFTAQGVQSKARSRVSAASSTSSNGLTSSGSEGKASALRRILNSPGVHQGPSCFDALSAKLIQNAGFLFCFMSGNLNQGNGIHHLKLKLSNPSAATGFCVSATKLALPDVGFISYGEMIDQGTVITGAVSIPVIGDGDNGYGNALNVKRTVKGYIRAGFAGILLEDQVSPKACGHTRVRKVLSREEAVMNIKAAVDARNESGSDIVIVARTDARQAISLEEALWRVKAFADAGADVLFIDALTSKEEMQKFCGISSQIPKMANMLEGGGKTPILSPVELEEIGFKIIAYPLSLLGVSIRAMQDALSGLKSGRIPPPIALPPFEEMKEIIGFNDYYKEEIRYSSIVPHLSKANEQSGESYYQEEEKEVIYPDVLDLSETFDTRSSYSEIRSKTLLIKITSPDGTEKLNVKIPAGFIEGWINIIPGIAGFNLKSMVSEALEQNNNDWKKNKRLIDFHDRNGDRIEVFLE